MAEVIVLFLDCYYVYRGSQHRRAFDDVNARVVEIARTPSYEPSNDSPAHQCDM